MRPANRRILFSALLVVATLLPITAARAAGGRATLTLQIVGLRSGSGLVLATLYASADGFPTKPDKAVIYAVEEFGAETSHITEITRGIDEGDAVFYHSFITWEERLRKPAPKRDRDKDKD